MLPLPDANSNQANPFLSVGVRHVKVWRIPEVRPVSPTKSRLNADATASSPKMAPKALSGRNCLLGNLGDNTFTCVASISGHEAVVGTDSGALCLLDDSEGCQKLSFIKYVDYGITSLAADFDHSLLWVAGRGRKIEKISFKSLRPLLASPSSPELIEKKPGNETCKGPSIICIGSLSSHLVTTDATRATNIYPMETFNAGDEPRQPQISTSAHRDPVLGIASLKMPNNLSAEFFTWSCKGHVHFWDTHGRCLDSRKVGLEQFPGCNDDMSNELRKLRATEGMELFVSGDRFGVLRYNAPPRAKLLHMY